MSLRGGRQFAEAARIYWLEIFPVTRRERRACEGRAALIPDPELRHDAKLTLRTKWGHAEGAAAFAALVPRADRRRFVRMAIAYEVLIDYLDTTSERPVDDPFANTFQLHQALFTAFGLKPLVEGDCYELHPHRDDGGYLAAQAKICREIFASLPSAPAIEAGVRRFATLYAEAQALYHSIEAGRDDSARAECTRRQAHLHPDLQWGEMLAAGSSSLPLLALLSAAFEPRLSTTAAELVAAAYYPWTSSLHILLHGVGDQAADRANGQFNQLSLYRSTEEAAERLALIAGRARQLMSGLPQSEMHAAILAGMGGYYLAPRQAWTPGCAEISRSVLETLGPLAKTALLIHRIRQRAHFRFPSGGSTPGRIRAEAPRRQR